MRSRGYSTKANGAGIAADPTLTCAWALRFLRLVRQASPFACPVAHLAIGVFLTSSYIFQFPLLRTSSFHRRFASRVFTDARAGIRLCFALPVFPSVQPELSLRFNLLLGTAETAILGLVSQTLVGLHPKVISLSYHQPKPRP